MWISLGRWFDSGSKEVPGAFAGHRGGLHPPVSKAEQHRPKPGKYFPQLLELASCYRQGTHLHHLPAVTRPMARRAIQSTLLLLYGAAPTSHFPHPPGHFIVLCTHHLCSGLCHQHQFALMDRSLPNRWPNRRCPGQALEACKYTGPHRVTSSMASFLKNSLFDSAYVLQLYTLFSSLCLCVFLFPDSRTVYVF